MKRKSILGLLTISSLVLLTSCDLNEMFNQHYGETSGGEEAGTLTDEEVINGALNVTAILVDNAAAPVRDSANYPNYVNTLKAMSGGYLKAQTKLAYLGEDDHTYDVSLAWTFDSAKFKVQDYADEGYKILRPAYNTIGFNQSEVLNLTCTATYGAKTGTLNYKITAVNDKEVIAIKDLQNNTDACVQGYVTGKIMGTSDNPYGIYVQDGTYAMMVYNPTKEAYNSVVIGDLVEVTGTTSFYNNTKQFTGSKSTVTKITENEKVSTVLSPVETELEDVDNIATEHYGALYKLTGCKVVEAHNYSNWYGGTETRNAVIEVVLRYKGKNVTVTSDRYNANYEDKVAFYNKAIEVLDSNGAKTLDYVGPMAMVPHVTEPGNATTNTADTKVAGFSFISSDKATVSNAAYQPNIQVTISGLPAIIGVGDKFALTATVNDTDNTAVTWASSNDSIATVSETGNVEAKAEGEVTITATSVADTNKKASVTFTIVADAGEKSYLKKTVTEVLQVENTDTQAYVVTGKIKGFGNSGTDANLSSNKYGSFILQDSNDDTKEILVYGSSTNNQDLAFKDGKYTFNRTVDMSKDAFANALAVGDEVTLIAIRADYGTTLELKGIFVAGANNARIPATSATIKQIIDSEPDASTIGGQKVYKSKGVITKWYQTNTNGTQYGNFYVKDDSTDTEVLVYGATAQENKISYNFNSSGKYTIGNPRDFLTNDATKDLKIGDEVEFECVRVDYKGAIQIAADSLKVPGTDSGDDAGDDPVDDTVEKSYLKKTVTEVLQVENTATQAYVVTGKIKGFGNNGTDANLSSNKYGSFILQDSNDDTKEILVYGSSTNNRDLAFAEGSYTFSRTVDMSKDAFANALAVGDVVTLIAIRADYGTTLQLKGIFVAGANNARVPATSATIKQIIDGEPDTTTIGGQKVYKTKGVITKWSGTNTNGTQYGNFYVKDDSTDTEVLVYGATAQENKISYNYNGSGKYTIGNPKDFLTNDATKDLKIGDEVEFECVRVDYGNSVQLAADSLKAVETDTGDDTGGDTQQTTVTFNYATDTGNGSGTAGAYSVTKSDVTMSVSNGVINGNYRVYKNATATFDAGNKKIKSVTFECTANGTNQYGPGCFTVPELNGEYTFAEKVGTWTGDQSSIVFTASSNQVRFTTCTVIYQ